MYSLCLLSCNLQTQLHTTVLRIHQTAANEGTNVVLPGCWALPTDSKNTRFHQIIRLCGFKYRSASWGGENCWGWRDAHLGVGAVPSDCSRWQAPGSGPFCFEFTWWLHYRSILEIGKAHRGVLLKLVSLTPTFNTHTHTSVWIPLWFQTTYTRSFNIQAD